LQKKCIAYEKKIVSFLPIKEKSIKKRERFFNYLVIEKDNKVYVNQRTSKDIWHNLFEFILFETDHLISKEEFLKTPELYSLLSNGNFSVDKISKTFRQKLTHQTITGRFFHISLKEATPSLNKYKAVSIKELTLLPFPKFIASYLQD
jgi:hypothetical protein